MMMMQRSNQFLNRRKMDFKISLNCVRRFVSFLQASQHGKHQAEQRRHRRPRRGREIDGDGGDGGAEGGVLEERGDAAADAVEPAAVGRGGAGGVHVCLEEFSAGDAMAHLPYGRHFHWACALPGSRLAPHPAPAHSAAPSSTRRGRGSGRGR